LSSVRISQTKGNAIQEYIDVFFGFVKNGKKLRTSIILNKTADKTKNHLDTMSHTYYSVVKKLFYETFFTVFCRFFLQR